MSGYHCRETAGWFTADLLPQPRGLAIVAFSLALSSEMLAAEQFWQRAMPVGLSAWPALAALAALVWLILKGPLARSPSLLKKVGRILLATIILVCFASFLEWRPLWAWMRLFGLRKEGAGVLLLLTGVLGWWIALLWILFSKGKRGAAAGGPTTQRTQQAWTNVPALRFTDVGGLERAKEQIRSLVQNRLNPGKYKGYGVVRNGILLHGPRGSGKTYLAEATAGEFKLNYYYVSSPQLLARWIGTTGENIRNVFGWAVSHKPILLFIDEIDSLGGGRQPSGSDGDPGGAGREYNNVVNQLMRSIDQHRNEPGFVLMAATNFLDGLDPALIREGRFDLRVRVDLPDEETRAKILEAQLSKRPWWRFDLHEFARKTTGASAAKLQALVDRAASFAADQGRKIDERDLRRALDEAGGGDRPLFKPVQWEDLVLAPETERDLGSVIKLLEPGRAERMRVPPPTGLLLVGPPGTGKTSIARLIATQTRRSFYPITSADVLGSAVGASVKRLTEIFVRAKEHAPSILFIDEIDGLLPRNTGQLSQHDIQLVEQALIEIGQLEPDHNVFLVATTNSADDIDLRVLRGGRFSEKVVIGVPSLVGYETLLGKHLDGLRLEAGVSIPDLARKLAGVSPADLEAICNTAKRFAMNRMDDGAEELPPLSWEDFDQAFQRVQVRF